MSQSPSYVRCFSELPGLQQAKTTRYQLTEKRLSRGTFYGIRVVETGAGPACEEVCLFTTQRAKAELLLKYLYENAVPAAQCVPVVSKLCTVTSRMKWEDHCGASTDPAAHCG